MTVKVDQIFKFNKIANILRLLNILATDVCHLQNWVVFVIVTLTKRPKGRHVLREDSKHFLAGYSSILAICTASNVKELLTFRRILVPLL